MRLFYLLTAFALLVSARAMAVTDSLGIKVIKNKSYVVHKVEKGEGLYSIARRYKVSVKDLQKANPGADKGLDIGQKILVPNNAKPAGTKNTDEPKEKPKAKKTELKENQTPEKKAKTEDPKKSSDDKKPIYHTVTKGETLNKIAVNHHMTVAELKKMNNGLKGGLKAGSKIIVGYNGGNDKKADDGKGSKNTSSKKTNTDPADSKYKTTKYGDKIDQKLYTEAEKVKKNLEENKKEGNTVSKEVNETGMGTSIDDGSVVAKKNMALHRTAPPGTVIKVTNPMNGKYVFVTVVAPLPKETTDPNCVIKITKTAANTLGILDSSFRVELHYTTEVVK
jgi:LysM repeat protein